MGERTFRRPESLAQERITRDMVAQFLVARGCTRVEDLRERNGQTIRAVLPNGTAVVARVKLCWRRGSDGRNQDRHTRYSAAQLLARVTDGDWVGTIERKMEREAGRGTTHLLLAQRDGEAITLAALVPINSVSAIWVRQRDISERLTQEGALGDRRKNHAMNGHSPTLWLQDERGGQAVAEALWSYPGVVDLTGDFAADTEEALPEEVRDPRRYIEGACRTVTVNAYERDRRARRECIAHHGASCVICGFDFGAVYGPEAEGHIHVHHLRPVAAAGGEYVLDPRVDLRPVCANCHSVIHLGNGCRSIAEVQGMLAAARRRTA
jgi:5-methylcytosine-specific restriction protein A